MAAHYLVILFDIVESSELVADLICELHEGTSVILPGDYIPCGWFCSGTRDVRYHIDYLTRNVPHGQVREVWYHSTVTGSWRHALVYPPPDYNTQTKIRYPVIYLQHGAGKDETGWIRQGKANFILDNLIARGNTKPMIIVMANGSMRGMQTFQVRFNHLDLFSYIGGFSGAAYVFTAENEKLDTKTAYNGAMSDPAMFANRVHLLGTGVGRTNEPDRMKSGLEKLHTSLDEGEIRHVFYESPDTSHQWQTWRRDLKVFAPRLSRLGANRSRRRARGTQEYANFQLWWFEYCD